MQYENNKNKSYTESVRTAIEKIQREIITYKFQIMPNNLFLSVRFTYFPDPGWLILELSRKTLL